MFFFLLPLGLPGGDQVDGLPPAAIDCGLLANFIDLFGRGLAFFSTAVSVFALWRGSASLSALFSIFGLLISSLLSVFALLFLSSQSFYVRSFR